MTIADLIAEHRALSRRTQLTDREMKRRDQLRTLLGTLVKDDAIPHEDRLVIEDELPTVPDLGGEDE